MPVLRLIKFKRGDPFQTKGSYAAGAYGVAEGDITGEGAAGGGAGDLTGGGTAKGGAAKGGAAEGGAAGGHIYDIDKSCCVCMDAEKNHALMPCGHLCVCNCDRI